MTEKRFTLIKDNLYDNGTYIGTICGSSEMICYLLNNLHEENNKIKSLLLKKVEELNDAYERSVKAGMPTGGIIGELDSFEEICRIIEWIE